MPNDHVDVYVKVIEDPANPKGFRFETNDLPMEGDVLYFKSCKKGQDFHIHYELVGFTGYTFPSNKNDALWVKHGSKTDCPTEAGTWGQFKPHEVQGRTLVVENKNDSPNEFAYTLRITNGTFRSLDPGGVNENGGVESFRLMSHLLVAVGSAALTFTALYAFGMLRLG